MFNKVELHPIQLKILKTLSSNSPARFSQLNEYKVENDQFNFHLKSLLAIKLLQKNKENLYELTDEGKQYVGKLNPQSLMLEKQSKLCVMIVCQRQSSNN